MSEMHKVVRCSGLKDEINAIMSNRYYEWNLGMSIRNTKKEIVCSVRPIQEERIKL